MRESSFYKIWMLNYLNGWNFDYILSNHLYSHASESFLKNLHDYMLFFFPPSFFALEASGAITQFDGITNNA